MFNKILWYFRVSLFYILLTISTATFFVFAVAFLLLPVRYRLRYKVLSMWSFIFISCSKHLLGLDYEIKGSKNIPKEACVILSNHQSTWDTIIMQIIFPAQSWVLKKELLKIPLFGVILASLKPIAIDRTKKSSVKDLIMYGLKRLEENIWVVIFPEGTRVKVNSSKPFSRSGAALAIEANKPIIPVAHNAGEFWPRGPIPKKPGKISIIIGEPIFPGTLDAASLTKNVEEWINNTRKTL